MSKCEDPLTIRQRNQLRAKVASGEYDYNEALEIIEWMVARKRGHQ